MKSPKANNSAYKTCVKYTKQSDVIHSNPHATETEMIYRPPFSDDTITEAIHTDMLKNIILPQMEEEEVKFSNKMVHRTLLATFQELSRSPDGPPKTQNLMPLDSLFLEVNKKVCFLEPLDM
jgi:hypothetical protein